MAAVTTIGEPSKYAFWSWPEPWRVPAARCTLTNAASREALGIAIRRREHERLGQEQDRLHAGTVSSALKNPASALPVLVNAYLHALGHQLMHEQLATGAKHALLLHTGLSWVGAQASTGLEARPAPGHWIPSTRVAVEGQVDEAREWSRDPLDATTRLGARRTFGAPGAGWRAGVDLSLIRANLRVTPSTERVRRAERARRAALRVQAIGRLQHLSKARLSGSAPS